MSFFEKLQKVTRLKRVVIEIITTGEKVTVVVTPKSSSDDPAILSMKPLILSYPSAAELDENFFKDITTPLAKTEEFFNGIESFDKSLSEAATKTKAAEAEKKKKADAAEKEKKAAEKSKAATKSKALDFTEEVVEEEIKVAEEVITEAKEVLAKTPLDEVFDEVEKINENFEEKKIIVATVPKVEKTIEDAVVEEEVPVVPAVTKRTPSLFD